MAHYAGDHVHKRLVAEESYKQKDYQAALKDAFLNTDADMKSGTCALCSSRLQNNTSRLQIPRLAKL